jgi:hypothetical protein
LGEGWGEGKNLAMQEVIAKALFPTAVFRLICFPCSAWEPERIPLNPLFQRGVRGDLAVLKDIAIFKPDTTDSRAPFSRQPFKTVSRHKSTGNRKTGIK